jgi:soluble lytic murein transglycosylase-like protein
MLRRFLGLIARRILALRKRPMLLLVCLLIGAFAYGSHRLWSARYGAHNVNAPAQLSAVFTPEVRYWSPLIYAWAAAYKIDPNLVATVIQIESCGDPLAVSSSGAQGLFQVMPFHFKAGEDMLDVRTNGRRGMEYLAESLEIAAGDPGLALAGYNGGHGVIKVSPTRWADETRRYAQWGRGIYQDAASGRQTSQAVQDWLDAGGKRLCQQASSRQQVALR